MDPWQVTPPERARHMEQFRSLNPFGGFVTGDQAKGFLLQSGLPPPVLGQIWSLADVNCDGKMDINEFSVACKLITMKLRGSDVPAVLPPSLKLALAGTGTATPQPVSPAGSISNIISPPQRPVAPMVADPFHMGMGIAQPLQQQQQPLLMSGGAMPQIPPPAAMMMRNTAPGIIGVPTPIPAVPPASLALGASIPPPNVGIARPTAVAQDPVSVHRSVSVTSQDSVVSPLMEWAVPNPSRLKYTQLFNQHDRSKTGFLTGVQARNILLGTGLPQPILAQVWGLSDLDADGRLSSEEFVLAMHLCDVAKQMGRLPPKLAPDLIPPSFRLGSRKQSIKSVPGSAVVSGQNTGSNTPVIDDPLLSPGGTSFEDKRKENFDKGQAELDRRRKVLQDMQNREREERDRKERAEYELKEKQRLELERREQEERERQMAIQREMEERRLQELRKNEEQKEAARREMERQRKAEMEENKRHDLLGRSQKEQDEVLRLKGVNHGLGLELSQLAEKVKDLSGKITETRVGVSSVKSEIDGMRSKRDGYMNDMGLLKAQLKDQNNRMLLAAQEKVRVEKLVTESEVKQINLKQLREKIKNLKDELTKKQSDSDIGAAELNDLKTTLSILIENCKTIFDEYREKREKVIALRKKHHQEFDYNAAWGNHSVSVAPVTVPDGPQDTVYYRAVYDFDSRNPDELSFATGAIILRNNDVVPDPGWLSGTLDGKSGWFPESFVETMPADEVQLPIDEPKITATSAQPAVVTFEPEPAAAFPEVFDPSGGEYYVALYPYESNEPGDLPFDAGETVYVTQSEGEWWTGQIGSDRVGIFPANYVAKQEEVSTNAVGNHENEDAFSVNNNPPAVVEDVGDNSSVNKTSSNFAPSMINDVCETSKTELEPYEEAEIKREMSEIAKAPPKSPKTTKSKKYEIATVLSNYQGTSEGQLQLTRGQLITVRKKSASGWWEGELQAKGKKRQLGWFPGSYVKVLGPGGGSRQSSSRTTPIPFDEIDMPMTAAPIYNDTKEQVIALYPYTAQNNDELTFIKDDVISIISKDEPDWWRGQLGSSVGLFPTNYVQPMSAPQSQDAQSFDEFGFSNNHHQEDGRASSTTSRSNDHDQFSNSPWPSTDQNIFSDVTNFGDPFAPQPFPTSVETRKHGHSNGGTKSSAFTAGEDETKRQESIRELIETEKNYMADMIVVKECFIVPLCNSRLLSHDELLSIFINWDDLMDCSNKLLKAFSVRKRTFESVILMIGDILCQHMPGMNAYIRFCSSQLRSAAIIQTKSEQSQEFRDFCKLCQQNPETKSMPLSSFLIKPMQRITKYPLIIKKILEYTPDNHPDRQNLEEALSKAEELCAQVNEGVREKENSDRLEWLQTHVVCEGLEERLIFNSMTNALGPRKFLHHGVLKKTKSGKELIGFLFNDFLLLASPNKPLGQTQFSFDRNRNLKFKIYRKPIFLNEITADEEGVAGEYDFVIGTENKTTLMYVCAPGGSEKRLWLKNIKEAKKRYLHVELQYLQRQRSKKVNAVGRLLVVVMDGENLVDKSKCVRRRPVKGKLKVQVVQGRALANRDPNGKSDPYCEVSLGSEIRKTRVIRGTLNPKWNDSMQFSVKDLHEDILCLTVYDKDYFSPDQFLGRTEIGISTIHEETLNRKNPWTKKFHLHEIETGDIVIKLSLQIFE